jgi:hypothetical protein
VRSGGSDPSDSTRDGQEIRGEEGQEGRERGGAPAGNPNPGVQGVLCDGKNKRKLLLFVTLLMSKNNSNFSFRTALASDASTRSSASSSFYSCTSTRYSLTSLLQHVLRRAARFARRRSGRDTPRRPSLGVHALGGA